MITLIFRADAIPRTTTREQWREIHRWKRETEKKLREAAELRMRNLAAFGTTHPELLRGYMDEIINPPVMYYPPLER